MELLCVAVLDGHIFGMSLELEAQTAVTLS